MRRGTNHRAPRRVVDRSNGEWDEFDPRLSDYYDDNCYTSGPGLHLPPNVPYSMRKTATPYKLFVSGIHPHTTQDGIMHIFSNYGNPLSVFRTRNKLQQPIAFVEFETQCEAENAIVQLDGKPPLNWEVCYAMPRRSEEIPYQQFASLHLDSDFERQTPMFQISGVGRQYPVQRNTESSMGLFRASSTTVELPTPCVVCGLQATLVCTICRTRYCSPVCQESDWPTHKPICRPPPALEPANPNSAKGTRAKQMHSASVKGAVTWSNGTSVSIQQNHGISLEETGLQHQTDASELTRAQPSVIRGIHPIDKIGPSSYHHADLSVTVHRNSIVGSKAKTPETRIVQDISNTPVYNEKCRLDGRGPNTHSSVEVPKGCPRSSNGNSNISPLQRNIKSGLSPMDSRPVSGGRQNSSNSLLGAIPKSRNFSVANNSPTTPIESPPNKALQLQTAKAAKIYATDFSSRELKQPSDKPQRVSVCYAKSPSEFYIQYYAFREILAKLMDNVSESAANSDPLDDLVEGLPCIALFHEDGLWYRAKILKVLPDGIGVRYVDYGNAMKIPNSFKSCRKMEHSLSEYPFYAIKVKLADVVPVNGSSWDADTNGKFSSIVLNQQFLMEYVCSDADVISVRLKNRDGSDLVTRLLKENLVKRATIRVSDELDRIPSADGIPSLPRLQQLVKNPPILQSQLPGTSNGNASSKTSSLIKSPQASVQVAAPRESNLAVPSQTSIPKHSPTRAALRQNASVIQPRAPAMSSVPVRPISLPIRQTAPAVSSTPPTPKPRSVIDVIEVGSTVMFQVTVLNGSSRFRGTLVRDDADISVFDFSSFAETIEATPNFRPSVGSIVAALSSFDSAWYRGYVTKVLKSSYNVHFVDFGNDEEAVVSVKPIPVSYQHETLSVRLSLVGNLTTATKKYADESIVQNSSHQLEITSKMADGSVLAKFIGENVPTCGVQIESWASTLTESDVSPASPAPIPDISSPNWEVGFSCDVILNVAEDVDCIYVQAVTDETSELSNKIQKELKEYFPYSVKPPTVPAVGSCVAAIFSDDGDLYRARITDVNGEAITIIFVDFGNSSTVPLGEIRVLPDRFYGYPACTKRISLARVERPAGPLPTTVKDVLAECIDKIYKIFVLPSTSKWTECTLMQDGEVLNERIIDCLERSTTSAASNPPSQMPKLEAASPSDVDMPDEVVAPVDNTLSNLSYENGPFMDLPGDGPFEAVVTSVEGPQIIMMHSADDQISKKLAQLEEDLTSYAATVARGHGPNDGEICIARCPDGKWHRIACLEVIPDPAGNRFNCLQVDYGESHVIDIDNIRRIPKRFIDFLPFLAQHAILEETNSMEDLKPDLVNRFEEILPKNSIVTVTVVGCLGISYVVRIPEVSDILAAEGLL